MLRLGNNDESSRERFVIVRMRDQLKCDIYKREYNESWVIAANNSGNNFARANQWDLIGSISIFRINSFHEIRV